MKYSVKLSADALGAELGRRLQTKCIKLLWLPLNTTVSETRTELLNGKMQATTDLPGNNQTL